MIVTLVALLALALPARAGQAKAAAPETAPSWYSLHMQATVIDQGHFRFHSPYSGPNSQLPTTESADSITSTLYFAARLPYSTELVLDPELAGGRGMSSTLGIAGFPNGEIYRVGDPRPTILTARLYLRHVFGLGGGSEKVEPGFNQVADTIEADRVVVVVGKFSLADFFDDNAYSHDPRTQFMNWAMMSSIAWDYPADTRGYTWGLYGEWRHPDWALRAAAVAEPKIANLMDLDRRIGRAHGLVAEGDHAIEVKGRKGTTRLLAYFNDARMGDYNQSLDLARQTGAAPDVTLTRAYGHTKYGFASSTDLEVADHLGTFARISWSDGRNESWAFAEVDHSLVGGAEWTPAAWGRPSDRAGLAEAYNGLATPHRRYLAAGGSGFMLGDGALRYGPELVSEAYYKLQATEAISVSPDAQLVINPGYNRDRGPIPVWGVRVHAEF